MSSAELIHPLRAQGMGAMAGGLQNHVVALKVRSLLSRSLRSHGLGVAALVGDLLFACRSPHPSSCASGLPRNIHSLSGAYSFVRTKGGAAKDLLPLQ